MKNLKITGFGLFLLISSASFAQTSHDKMDHAKKSIDKPFESWDTNKDEKIDKKEFKSTFEKMDTFKMWDASNDKSIDKKEWDKGVAMHSEKMDDKELGSFNDWDANSDKKISQTEYTDGSFKMWDKDGNGYVDSEEYTACQKSKK